MRDSEIWMVPVDFHDGAAPMEGCTEELEEITVNRGKSELAGQVGTGWGKSGQKSL